MVDCRVNGYEWSIVEMHEHVKITCVEFRRTSFMQTLNRN